MSIVDVITLVLLVAGTAALFGLVEHRRNRPLTVERNFLSGSLTGSGQADLARVRAITRILEVLAAAAAITTTIVLVVLVAGAVL